MSRDRESIRKVLANTPAGVDLPCKDVLYGGRQSVDPLDDTHVSGTNVPVDAATARVTARLLGVAKIRRHHKRLDQLKQHTEEAEANGLLTPATYVPPVENSPDNTRSEPVEQLPGDVHSHTASPSDDTVESPRSPSGSSSGSDASPPNAETDEIRRIAALDGDTPYGIVDVFNDAGTKNVGKEEDLSTASAEEGPTFAIFPGLRVKTWWTKVPVTNAYGIRASDACRAAHEYTPKGHQKYAPAAMQSTNKAWALTLIYRELPLMIDCLGGQRACVVLYDDITKIVSTYAGVSKKTVTLSLIDMISMFTSEIFPSAPAPNMDEIMPYNALRPGGDGAFRHEWWMEHRRVLPVQLLPFLYIFMPELAKGVEKATSDAAEDGAASEVGTDTDAHSGASAAATACTHVGALERPEWMTTPPDRATFQFFDRIQQLADALSVRVTELEGEERTWRAMVHAQLRANITRVKSSHVDGLMKVNQDRDALVEELRGVIKSQNRRASCNLREEKRKHSRIIAHLKKKAADASAAQKKHKRHAKRHRSG